jgi:hypothetical protein
MTERVLRTLAIASQRLVIPSRGLRSEDNTLRCRTAFDDA